MPKKTQVEFDAPTSLIDRADAVAELLGIPRRSLLIGALRDKLEDFAPP